MSFTSETPFSPQRGSSSLASLGQSCMPSLSSLEQENHQLKQALAKMESQLDGPNQACQEKYEGALLSRAITDPPRRVLDRYMPCTNVCRCRTVPDLTILKP